MAREPSKDKVNASVLAFERKLDPSDGLMFAGSWEQRDKASDWKPVTIREKAVRGTISNRLKGSEEDPAKLDAAIENPNLQTVDAASLPPGADTLKLVFTLKILPNVGRPSACNNADYAKKLVEIAEAYRAEKGFRELSQRYAANLANGRFLWRNRLGAQEVEVRISKMRAGKKEWTKTFNARDEKLSLRCFPEPGQVSGLKEVSEAIAEGLSGELPVVLEVEAFARMGEGQEVYPSQKLILDQNRANVRGAKSRVLYFVRDMVKDQDVAAIHSQKLGNAIRTVDDWYPDLEENDGAPIAVEPYGAVTVQGRAWRPPASKRDFYSLLDDWMERDKEPEKSQKDFLMAVLIRGGVFGKAD